MSDNVIKVAMISTPMLQPGQKIPRDGLSYVEVNAKSCGPLKLMAIPKKILGFTTKDALFRLIIALLVLYDGMAEEKER